MTLVQQITPFTCGLACIESVTSDFGVKITQCEILVRYKELLKREAPHPDAFGSITWRGIGEILADRGLDVEAFSSSNSNNLESFLSQQPHGIIISKIADGIIHSFRIGGYNDGRIHIMDPGFGLLKAKEGWVVLADFISLESYFIVITSPKET